MSLTAIYRSERKSYRFHTFIDRRFHFPFHSRNGSCRVEKERGRGKCENFNRKFAFIRTRMWTHSLVYIHFLILSILVNSLGGRNFLAKREREKRRKSRGCAIYREVLSDLGGEIFVSTNQWTIYVRCLAGGGGDLSSSGLFSARRVCRRISARIEILENTSTGFFPPSPSPPLPPRDTDRISTSRNFHFLNFQSHPRWLH